MLAVLIFALFLSTTSCQFYDSELPLVMPLNKFLNIRENSILSDYRRIADLQDNLSGLANAEALLPLLNDRIWSLGPRNNDFFMGRHLFYRNSSVISPPFRPLYLPYLMPFYYSPKRQ